MQISLQNKIRFTVVSIVLLFAPFMFFYFPNHEKKLMLENYDKEIQKTAQTVALGVKIALTEQNYEGVQTALDYAKSDARLAFIALIQVDTAWSEDHRKYELKKSIFSLFPEKYPLDINQPMQENSIVKKSPFTSSILQGEIMVSFTTVEILKNINSIRLTLFWVSLVISVCGLLLGLWLAQSISKPILKLRDANQQVGKGLRNISVVVNSKDEIGQLAKSFNNMVSQLTLAENVIILKNEIIEKKNKDIIDSIRYAKRIQEAILPKTSEMQEYIPEIFILYKPKDIVSGDFYWFALKGKRSIIAACDCTGHGVPGAFVSMVGNDLLNQIIIERNIDNPSEILKKLHDGIVYALYQKTKDVEYSDMIRDGMDIALCSIDMDKKEVLFSGAIRPMWLITKNGASHPAEFKRTIEGDYELVEFKGDRYGIGGLQVNLDPTYTTHKINVQKGDTFYLSTDGYSDQFGGAGEKDKQFSKKRLLKLLLNIQHLSMDEQRKKLDEAFESWRSKHEQTDDICVIGIRI